MGVGVGWCLEASQRPLPSPPPWPAFPLSSYFASGPVFFYSFPRVEATLTLVPSQGLSTELSGDAQEATGGTLGPLVMDLSTFPEAWSSRSSRLTRWLWQATGTCTGTCPAIRHYTAGSSRPAAQCPRKTSALWLGRLWLMSPQIYFTHLGKNIGKDPFASRGEGGIEDLFLINNILGRPTACGCSPVPHCGICIFPVPSGGSWLPGRRRRVSGWRPRLGSEAAACHPGIPWERWLALTGSFRGAAVVPGSQPALPLFLPSSRQVVWFLPSVGDGDYVVASHILWYVCPTVSTFQTQIWHCVTETLTLKVLFWFL